MDRFFTWPSWIGGYALFPPLGLNRMLCRPSRGGVPSPGYTLQSASNDELRQKTVTNTVNVSGILVPVYKAIGVASFVGFLACTGFLLRPNGILNDVYAFNVSVSKNCFGRVTSIYYPPTIVVASGLVSALETLECLHFPGDLPSLWRKGFRTLLDVVRTLAVPNMLSCGQLSGSLAAVIFHNMPVFCQEENGGHDPKKQSVSAKIVWKDVLVFLINVFADAPMVHLSLDF